MAAQTRGGAKVETNSLIILHLISLTLKWAYYVKFVSKYPWNYSFLQKSNMAAKPTVVYECLKNRYGQIWFAKDENEALLYIWDIFVR